MLLLSSLRERRRCEAAQFSVRSHNLTRQVVVCSAAEGEEFDCSLQGFNVDPNLGWVPLRLRLDLSLLQWLKEVLYRRFSPLSQLPSDSSSSLSSNRRPVS